MATNGLISMETNMKLLFITFFSLFITIAGKWHLVGAFEPYSPIFLTVGLLFTGLWLISKTYDRSGSQWTGSITLPSSIRLTAVDWLKAFVCWFNAFQRTYAVPPGLYYTGSIYDPATPLLVTSNYHLTVFLLLRALRGISVRLLVVDTDGINVWCAAGKGAFDNTAVQRQVDRFRTHLSRQGAKIEMVLPKLSLSGIDLHGLRQSGIRPVIGPIQAKDLPVFLSRPELADQGEDRYRFDLTARLFTWLPGLVQYLTFGLLLFMGLLMAEAVWGIRVPMGILPLLAVLATLYPLLFPSLPGHGFAVKGLWMAGGVGIILVASVFFHIMPAGDAAPAIVLTFALSLFIGLSYTGNSAVSCYSQVRGETARFLPITVFLFMASFVSYIVKEAFK